jgi:hypothetical protein
MGIRIDYRTTKGGYGMEQLGFNGFVKAIFDGYRKPRLIITILLMILKNHIY